MTLDVSRKEFALIREFQRFAGHNTKVTHGIGDDCATLGLTPGAQTLVTTDMLMDGRHFRLGTDSLHEIGHKCLAVNLSDIAAMAGRAVAAFVSVALPRHDAERVGVGLIEGMNPLVREFGVALAGGDTNAWDGPLVVSITVVGEATSHGPVLRSGAQVGDRIFVTGPLGGSLGSGRHLRSRPRIREAMAIHERVPIHAMIDLSDGLAGDLAQILAASGGLGATLDANALPIHDDVWRAFSGYVDHDAALASALGDGEDFELCFTLDPADASSLIANPPYGVAFHLVGVVEAEPGLRIQGGDGRISPVITRGFDHLAGA